MNDGKDFALIAFNDIAERILIADMGSGNKRDFRGDLIKK